MYSKQFLCFKAQSLDVIRLEGIGGPNYGNRARLAHNLELLTERSKVLSGGGEDLLAAFLPHTILSLVDPHSSVETAPGRR